MNDKQHKELQSMSENIQAMRNLMIKGMRRNELAAFEAGVKYAEATQTYKEETYARIGL